MKIKYFLLLLGVLASCSKEDIQFKTNTTDIVSNISKKEYTLQQESYFNQKSGVFFSWADNGSNQYYYMPKLNNTSSKRIDWFNGGQAYHDVNGDGYQDILVSSSNTNDESFFQWYINSGDNKNFNSNQSLITESTSGYTSHKFLKTDVNNDGLADFIALGVDERVLGDYSGNFTVLIGMSDKTFKVNNIPNPNRYWFHNGAAGDLNGDGNVDVIGAEFIWWGDGLGNFTQDEFRFSPIVDAPLAYEILDINGDGLNDIIIGTQTEIGTDIIVLNNGGRFDTTNQIIYLPKTNFSGIMDIEIVDIDLDGDLDIVELRQDSNNISYIFLYENDNLNFRLNTEYFENSLDGNLLNGNFDYYGWSSFKFDDIDNDGIDDIVAENYQDGEYNGLKNIDGIWKKVKFRFGN